jgi:hypothetical protein
LLCFWHKRYGGSRGKDANGWLDSGVDDIEALFEVSQKELKGHLHFSALMVDNKPHHFEGYIKTDNPSLAGMFSHRQLFRACWGPTALKPKTTDKKDVEHIQTPHRIQDED